MDQTLKDLVVPVNTNLYYDLYRPSSQPAPLLIGLHGYGDNKSWMMSRAREMAPASFAVVALQGLHQHIKDPREPGGPLRYGFGWLTNFRPDESVALHHGAILELIRELTGAGIALAESIFLVGFSQSCALAYRFAFQYAAALRGVIGIAGGLPGDWDISESYHETSTAVLHMTGSGDQFYPPERVRDYEERLRPRASDVVFRSFPAGHEISADMCAYAREWLINQN